MQAETTVDIRREVMTGDGAGGTTVSTTDTIASGLPASVRFYQKDSLHRQERREGVQVEEMRVIVLYVHPFHEVRQNDIVRDNTTLQEYLAVNDGRKYTNSYQIDARRMS